MPDLTDIRVELANLSTLLQEHIREQREINAHFKRLHDRTHEFVNGNGKPGAKVRLDRVERRTAWINAVASAIAVIATKDFWMKFTPWGH